MANKTFVVILPDNLEENDIRVKKPIIGMPRIEANGKQLGEEDGITAFEISDDTEFAEKVDAKLKELGKTMSYAGRRELTGYEMMIIIKPTPIS